MRLLILLTMIFTLRASLPAANIVTYSLTDSGGDRAEALSLTRRSLSNEDGRTRIAFDIRCTGIPFTIYKAEWVNCDSIISPIEPFSLIAQTDEVSGKDTEWHIAIDFPFSDTFSETDALLLHTDRGIVRCPTSTAGELLETIDLMHDEYERQVETSRRSSRNAWMLFSVTATAALVAGLTAWGIIRRRLSAKHKELEEMSLLIAERSERNRELEAKVDALYGSRLDTLNMLCNEYFEKNTSENLKLTLFNEVEKHILALRDSRSVAELEKIVNTYLDGIMLKVRAQLPGLGVNDIRFLTYLYAGFSPRAVCIFTDIKVKNFYNRRSRLRERILASDAPDKEWFVSRM